MKLSPLLLAGSLLANAALFGTLAWRPSLSPPAFRDFFRRNFHAADEVSAPPALRAAAPPPARTDGALWSALQSDDLTSLVARLRHAGFPPNVIREIVRSQVNARYRTRISELVGPEPNVPYWRSQPYYSGSSKRYEEVSQIERERAKLLRDLLADDFFATNDVTAAQRRQFGTLSRQKIDAVQRIEDDYTEMMSQVRAAMNGVTLPEDREKLALLAREKQADLAAILAPEELADYTLRSSAITSMLRGQLGTFDASEAEFRAIFQQQLTLNEKFPPSMSGGMVSSGDYEQRRQVQQQLEEQLKATLGDARYADYSRATNREFQQLNRLAQRDNLSAETAVQAFSARDRVAAESGRIFDNSALSTEEKRAALQSLAQNTRNQLLATLGPTSGPAYVKLADQWLGNVERGSAVSFTNSGNMTSISMNNGTIAMVSIGGGSPSYRRLPGSAPTPPPRQ